MEESEESLYCTNCGGMLHFKRKSWKSGNLIIVCDYCGHQHCRVVIDGMVTGDRWDSRWRGARKIHGVIKNSENERNT